MEENNKDQQQLPQQRLTGRHNVDSTGNARCTNLPTLSKCLTVNLYPVLPRVGSWCTCARYQYSISSLPSSFFFNAESRNAISIKSSRFKSDTEITTGEAAASKEDEDEEEEEEEEEDEAEEEEALFDVFPLCPLLLLLLLLLLYLFAPFDDEARRVPAFPYWSVGIRQVSFSSFNVDVWPPWYSTTWVYSSASSSPSPPCVGIRSLLWMVPLFQRERRPFNDVKTSTASPLLKGNDSRHLPAGGRMSTISDNPPLLLPPPFM